MSTTIEDTNLDSAKWLHVSPWSRWCSARKWAGCLAGSRARQSGQPWAKTPKTKRRCWPRCRRSGRTALQSPWLWWCRTAPWTRGTDYHQPIARSPASKQHKTASLRRQIQDGFFLGRKQIPLSRDPPIQSNFIESNEVRSSYPSGDPPFLQNNLQVVDLGKFFWRALL